MLAKLERLQQLLLSSDLDFEMKLERLRQIRETLRKLNAVVKEESREEKISKASAEKEKEAAELAKRREKLEGLIAREKEHIAGNDPLAKESSLSDAQRTSLGELAKAQDKTRQDTKSLADELREGAKSKHLLAATENMQAAGDALGKAAPAEAAPPMEKALAELEAELEDVKKKEEEAKSCAHQGPVRDDARGPASESSLQ